MVTMHLILTLTLNAHTNHSLASHSHPLTLTLTTRSAADEIIADPSSLVGSIGVISRGFGYVKALKKQGVSRRVHTAGESKAGLILMPRVS